MFGQTDPYSGIKKELQALGNFIIHYSLWLPREISLHLANKANGLFGNSYGLDGFL